MRAQVFIAMKEASTQDQKLFESTPSAISARPGRQPPLSAGQRPVQPQRNALQNPISYVKLYGRVIGKAGPDGPSPKTFFVSSSVAPPSPAMCISTYVAPQSWLLALCTPLHGSVSSSHGPCSRRRSPSDCSAASVRARFS
jgi:hypothetical protein